MGKRGEHVPRQHHRRSSYINLAAGWPERNRREREKKRKLPLGSAEAILRRTGCLQAVLGDATAAAAHELVASDHAVGVAVLVSLFVALPVLTDRAVLRPDDGAAGLAVLAAHGAADLDAR